MTMAFIILVVSGRWSGKRASIRSEVSWEAARRVVSGGRDGGAPSTDYRPLTAGIGGSGPDVGGRVRDGADRSGRVGGPGRRGDLVHGGRRVGDFLHLGRGVQGDLGDLAVIPPQPEGRLLDVRGLAPHLDPADRAAALPLDDP